jgi:hypothetical protein
MIRETIRHRSHRLRYGWNSTARGYAPINAEAQCDTVDAPKSWQRSSVQTAKVQARILGIYENNKCFVTLTLTASG